jgi:ribosome biogenesis GTPase / thiamine phosphate phosphatase
LAKQHAAKPQLAANQAPLVRAEARVVCAFGKYSQVRLEDGRVLTATPRGKRFEAVCGDLISVSLHGLDAVIEKIHPRTNSLFRQDEVRTKVFAANVDAILFMVAADPHYSDVLLGRALIAAHVANIPLVIVLNKTDLPQAAAARERLGVYARLGLQVVELCARDAANALAAMQALLAGKRSLILGGSGVGKSTLINALVPGANVATQAISLALNTGKHTTTTTIEYTLPASFGTAALLDSPGFQTFGLHHVSATQLSDAFPEIAKRVGQCRFYNCTHVHEPGCAVLDAVDSGEMAEHRHVLYLQVLEELKTTAW